MSKNGNGAFLEREVQKSETHLSVQGSSWPRAIQISKDHPISFKDSASSEHRASGILGSKTPLPSILVIDGEQKVQFGPTSSQYTRFRTAACEFCGATGHNYADCPIHLCVNCETPHQGLCTTYLKRSESPIVKLDVATLG